MFPKTRITHQKGKVSGPSGGSLHALLACPVGVAGLLDYLDKLVSDANKDYLSMAECAVFNENARMEALHKHGVVEGIRLVRKEVESLLPNGK